MASFGAWLAKQASNDNEIGDLAKDFIRDCVYGYDKIADTAEFSYPMVRLRMIAHGACLEAMEALRSAQVEFLSEVGIPTVKPFKVDGKVWHIICPLCLEHHAHGAGRGHRNSHCRRRIKNDKGYELDDP
jgi:hypothetical protein